MQTLFTKRLGALRPADDAAMEALEKIKAGETVRVEFKRVRNPKQHRMYWALMGLLATYADTKCSPEDVSDWVKVAVGHSYTANYLDGTSQVKPSSIAFGNLSQDRWDTFFDKVIDFAVTKIMPGTHHEDLRAELNDMIAERPHAESQA